MPGQRRIPREVALACVLSAALVAGCSSNDTAATVPSSSPTTIASSAPPTSPSTTTPTTTVTSDSIPESTTTTAIAEPPASTAPSTVPVPTLESTTVPNDVSGSSDEIIARYVGYWDTRFAVLSADSPGDPNDARFAEFATGDQISSVSAETQRFNDQGRRLARPPDPVGLQRVVVQSINGDRAELQECFVDDALVVDRASGSVVDNDVVTLNSTATMRFVDGVWKLEKTTVIQRWAGVAGCALAE